MDPFPYPLPPPRPCLCLSTYTTFHVSLQQKIHVEGAVRLSSAAPFTLPSNQGGGKRGEEGGGRGAAGLGCRGKLDKSWGKNLGGKLTPVLQNEPIAHGDDGLAWFIRDPINNGAICVIACIHISYISQTDSALT